MKLYYSPGACSLADHIALLESGLPFTLEKVDLKAKRTADGGDYREINPKGYVPALELDGEVLTENIAVLSWIANASGKLQPANGIGHWRVLEMTAFVSTELHKNFKPFFVPGSSEEDKQAAREMLAQRFGTVATSLDGRDFVVGDELSIADCYLFVMLMWSRKQGVDVPEALASYFERLKARPAFMQALADEGLG